MSFVESRYSAERLRANRITVLTAFVLGSTALLVVGATTSWPMSNAIGTTMLWLVTCALFWWMFASKKAGPIALSAHSKGWFKSAGFTRGRRP